MSETVRYDITITGFKGVKELNDVKFEIEYNHFFIDFDFRKDEKQLTLTFEKDQGWRGGGRSCEEIVRDELDNVIEQHPHLVIEVFNQYYDQAPTHMFTIRGDKT